jgi:hypothetical protein
MSDVILEAAAWTPRRWLFAILLIFVLHVGLIYAMARRGPPVLHQPVAGATFKLLARPLTQHELAESLFAADPTVFVLPTPEGFSGEAWLKRKSLSLEVADWDEPPRWLALSPASLGKTFSTFVLEHPVHPFAIVEKGPPQPGTLEILPPTDNVSTQSVLHIEGDLVGRALLAPPVLPAWLHSEPLTNSVILIAVNRAGEVVRAQLMTRCGKPDADLDALDRSRKFRFAPGPVESLGRAVFQWYTLPATNAPAAARAQ